MQFIKFLFSKIFLIQVLAFLLIVFIGIYAIQQHLKNYTKHGEYIELDDYKGYHLSELSSILAEKKLRFEVIDSVYYPTESAGSVITQLPEAGQKVKENRKLYITINASSPPKMALPALEDLSLRQAVSILSAIGIVVDELIYQPNICVNCVLRVEKDSITINAGELLPRGSAVNLVLGQGLSNEMVEYPALIGKNYEEVYNILKKRGLNIGAVNYSACENEKDSMEALLYRQIPDIFKTKMVNLGQSINLFFTSDQEMLPKVTVDSLYRIVDVKPEDEINP